MIEEQALCRVHRVGQRRDVTTVRYLIRHSFEEVSYEHFANQIRHRNLLSFQTCDDANYSN
jgi:hypothetical protein